MNFGKQLTDREVLELYTRHPNLFVENPTVVVKDYKNNRVMFIVIDNIRYLINENKETKEMMWFKTK